MNIILNWQPPTGNSSTNQQIQYKKNKDTVWLNAATVNTSIGTYTLENLNDNVVWNFRIVWDCKFGSSTQSEVHIGYKITCPLVTLTQTFNSVTVSFQALGGDITSYKIDLLNDSGTSIIASQTNNTLTDTVSTTFVDLTPSTNYNIKVTVIIDSDKQKVCGNFPFTTAILPTCPTPTNVTATII